MDMPTLRQLRSFVAVIDHGGISDAARALHLTQPAASQQLRELERILGVRLMERAGGRVLPTAAGTALLAPARRALGAGAEVAATAAAWRSGQAGRVRLGTGATACIHRLPPVLAAARRAMPGLDIVVATGNSPDILRQLRDGALDLGLVTLPRALGRGLRQIPLCHEALMALIPAALAPPDAVSPEALAALPLILYETGSDTRRVIDAWFAAAGLVPRPIMQLGSVEAIKVLVGGGLGASLLPAIALAGGVPGARAVAPRPAIARELGLVMRADKQPDRGTQVLLDALLALAC